MFERIIIIYTFLIFNIVVLLQLKNIKVGLRNTWFKTTI